MRICHVSPHLPPDQAANALLPAALAAWADEHGHDVSLVAYEPAQGRSAALAVAGKAWRLPRKPPAGGIARALRIESIKHVRRIREVLNEAAKGADLLHLHSNGLIIEAAAGWAASRRVPYVLTLYGTEVWHY